MGDMKRPRFSGASAAGDSRQPPTILRVDPSTAPAYRAAHLAEYASMPKALAMSGLVVAVLILLICGIDLAVGLTLGGVSKTMDITFLIAAVIMGYVSWMTYREQA